MSENIITELARREFDYCHDHGLALWLTLEQAKHLITQDGRIEITRDRDLDQAAELLVSTFYEFPPRWTQDPSPTSTQVEQLVRQHLGDDWTIEGHEALMDQILQVLNTHKKGNPQ